ncbi:OCIA domain-containing protein 1-like [Anticarsia gemmatalis]|uniref:OCIA domain-containing protein 1-like n=1 Tax=Anticarsia gemmatalis TaxID=129554 RepID=UPI003F758E9F
MFAKKKSAEKDKKAAEKVKEEEKENCNCYADSRTKKACPPVRNVTHPLRYYEFTQEEMKALEECDKESFYQRCLPFSTIFATVTYAAIRYGTLKKNIHFGAVPKLMFAVFLGYVCGRISYLSHCDEKLRQLPDKTGKLGALMRQYHAEKFPPPPKK